METRGWKLCICFGLLSVALAEDSSQSVPGAREDESTFTKFTLVHDSKSHLFSSCFAELNTVEATLQAIEVEEGKKFTRYLIDSDAEVTWEDGEGEDGVTACALKANEAGLPMFKHSNGVCSLATEGVYNPKRASCDGEAVFIIDPLDLCFTPLGMEEPGHQYYAWKCETTCGSSGIFTDYGGGEVDPDSFPSEIVECCSTGTTPCLYAPDFTVTPCDVDRYCYFSGMMLPSAATAEERAQFEQFFTSSQDASMTKILVNVRYVEGNVNGIWYHFPGEVMVNSDEWDPDVTVPTEGFVVLNNKLKLESVGRNDLVFAVCQEREKLPACPEAK